MDNDSFADGAGPARPPRDAVMPAGQSAPAPVRTAKVVTGDLLLTVNPVDGSEIEPCPPGQQPPRPARRTAADRADRTRAAQPPVPPGPAAPPLPLLDREEERERLVRLLGQGRSVRLTGPAGSGRSVLLDAVAEECAGLAPDGVVRLNGLHRTPAELLHELYAAVYASPEQRPDRNALAGFVRDIGAVVVLDDLEFGGAALDEFLDAAPECAFLLAATPEIAAPSPDSPLEEVFLGGLGRATALDLLHKGVGRALTEEETNWAGDLWFESEGLPLRFVQAAALLRQCDELRGDPEAFEEFAPFDAARGRDVPLPTLGEGAAPAPLLASRLSESARGTLRFAVALGGEVPHQAHLPALIGDTHADAALGELMSCGLLSPAGPRYRLAAGVLAQLREKGYDEGADACVHTAAQHYAWWSAHPSVTPERAVAEADALLASLTSLVPGTEPGHPSTAVLLARGAAPAFAAGLHWGAWERALRVGSEAARIVGEVAEEAYFHHELGILALCTGNLDRARAELEASIGMRGALADKSGTVSGRRALALVEDRSAGPTPRPETLTPALPRTEDPLSPPRGVPAALPLSLSAAAVTARLPRSGAEPEPSPEAARESPAAKEPTAAVRRPAVLGGARRNLVAAGAGVVLAAVLGTVVTLGATSGQEDVPTDNVRNGQQTEDDSFEEDWDDPQVPAAGVESGTPAGKKPSGTPSAPGPSGTSATAPASPVTSTGPRPSTSSSRPGSPSDSTRPPRPTPTKSSPKPTKSPTPSSSSSSSQSPDPTPSGSESPPEESPGTETSAGGPAGPESGPASGTESASTPVL